MSASLVFAFVALYITTFFLVYDVAPGSSVQC